MLIRQVKATLVVGQEDNIVQVNCCSQNARVMKNACPFSSVSFMLVAGADD